MFNSSRFKSITWQFIKSHFKVGLFSIIGFVAILSIISVISNIVTPEKFEPIRSHSELWSAVIPIILLSVLVTLGALVILSVIMSFQSTKEMKDRLQLLNRAATSFSQGNLKHRLPVSGDDEISTLTMEWNDMADRLERQVVTLQRLSEENAKLVEQSANGAVLEERQRLARELHDSISQQLFAMSITSAAVNKSVQPIEIPPKIKQQIGYLEEMAASIQNEMRTLIFHLRPIQLEGQSLIEGVRSLLREMEERHGLDAELKVSDENLSLPGWENHLFRLIQEAIANVMKHAKASKVIVSIQQKSNRLFVTIEDNGEGFDITSQKRLNSFGLKTMRERAQEIGGVFDLYSEPGKGTKIHVFVPLAADS